MVIIVSKACYYIRMLTIISLIFSISDVKSFLVQKSLINEILHNTCSKEYLEGRLVNAFRLLAALDNKGCFSCLPTAEELGIQHEQIVDSVEKVRKEKSLKPLLVLWQTTSSQNEFPLSTLFVREYLLVLITAINNSRCFFRGAPTLNDLDFFELEVAIGTPPISGAFSLNNALNLYNTLSNMPVLSLLATIDFLVIQIHQLLHNYQLDNTLSWRAWLTHYWWTIPVTAFVLLKITFERLSWQQRLNL